MGVAAAGLAAGGALAACSPQTANSADGSGGATAQTGVSTTATTNPYAKGELTWLPPEPADPTDIEEELTADVVVVGCGVAGTTAARSASEEGASVIVIEKSANPAVCRSGEYAVIGGEVFGTWGRGDGFIDIEEAVEHELDEMCYYPKRAIYSKWAHGIGKVFDWFCAANPNLYICPDSPTPIPADKDCVLWPFFVPVPEGWDYKAEKHPTFPSTAKFANPDQHVILMSNWKKAEEAGAQVFTGHFAEKLIKEGNRVTGVFARNAETDKYKKITAKKGVILATGDYSGNKAMVEYYVPEYVLNTGGFGFWPDVDVEGNPTNTGDGEKLGAWVNAAISQHHAPMAHYMGEMNSIGASPYLRLNKLGKRFMNEDVPGQQVTNQTESQPGQTFWTIFDSSWPEQLKYFQAMHASVNFVVDSPTPENLNIDGINPYITRDAVDKAVEAAAAGNGWGSGIFKANTIDEILALTEIEDIPAAKASIERYNELAKKGVDEDFGKPGSRMFALENPPYYVFQSGVSGALVVIGGLESDEDCHVYDNDGHIIPGLYVAGNVQGNRYAVAYPIAFKGISHSLCLFYGYTAGKNAVAGV
jgi:hypothetical protein